MDNVLANMIHTRVPHEIKSRPTVESRDIDFFFFQAEDGIRDYKVTGVQTCALPISPGALDGAHQLRDPRRLEQVVSRAAPEAIDRAFGIAVPGEHHDRRMRVAPQQDRKSVV